MALIACPGCSLPRTAGDATSACPVCGHVAPSPPEDDGDASAMTLGPEVEPVSAAGAVSAPIHLAPSPTAINRLPPSPVSAQVYIATAPVTAPIRPPRAARPGPGAAPASDPIRLTTAPPSARPVAPRPVVVPPREPSLIPWVLAGIGFGGTFVCAAGWYLASTDLPHLPETVAPAAEVAAREVAPPPRRASASAEPAAVEIAPPPRLAAVTEPPNPWPVVREGEFAVLRIDQPNDTYKLDVIGAGNRLKLVGRVAKLSVEGVTGGAVLDATELVTKAVSFVSHIDGGATVRLKAQDGGTVHIRGVLNGATLAVDAPGGTVTFDRRNNKDAVAGRVTVTARSVSFAASVLGPDTRVDVTLTTRGVLRFTELAAGAKLLYRAARPEDPPLVVNPGSIKDTAECKRDD